MARNDPALFMQRFTPPVLFDEIQYAPEILPYIKISVDTSGKKGDFLANRFAGIPYNKAAFHNFMIIIAAHNANLLYMKNWQEKLG